MFLMDSLLIVVDDDVDDDGVASAGVGNAGVGNVSVGNSGAAFFWGVFIDTCSLRIGIFMPCFAKHLESVVDSMRMII